MHVLKFGGTSVANISRIQNAAKIINNTLKTHPKLVVVVSAMAGATNSLADLCNNLSPHAYHAENDLVLSTGEQVSTGLLTLALKNENLKASALMSWQIPISTNNTFGNARISSINREALHKALSAADILVIPGFQGINDHGELRTLGRGGSDTTAVEIADALGCDCTIYTDVDGIFSADPRMVSTATLLPSLTYAQALALSQNGAKVMHYKSIEASLKSHTQIKVCSSFNSSDGTVIGRISPTTSSKDYLAIASEKVSVFHLPHQEVSSLKKIIHALAQKDILYTVINKAKRLYVCIAKSDEKQAHTIIQGFLGATSEIFTLKTLTKITLIKCNEQVTLGEYPGSWHQHENASFTQLWLHSTSDAALLNQLHQQYIS